MTTLRKSRYNYFAQDSASGVLMIISAICAMILANSPWLDQYQSILQFNILNISFKTFVKDILMSIFFLVIGMELKKELKEGSLTPPGQLRLTICAALAGMIAPAMIFILINYDTTSTWKGAAIPSATDIAFALCVFTFSKKSLPPQAKIFLLALATFDDIGAIIIIMIINANSASFSTLPIMMILVGMIFLFILNYYRSLKLGLYLITGVYLAICLFLADISTSIAGIAVGLSIPLSNKTNHSPISRGIKFFSPIANFFILPLFAFTASGINLHNLNIHDFISPIPVGITCGLFLGKQLGVFGITRFMVYLGLATKPQGITWTQFYGISVLTGIGFTMSLFMGHLVFLDSHLQDLIKIGVVSGSILSAILGTIILRNTSKSY